MIFDERQEGVKRENHTNKLWGNFSQRGVYQVQSSDARSVWLEQNELGERLRQEIKREGGQVMQRLLGFCDDLASSLSETRNHKIVVCRGKTGSPLYCNRLTLDAVLRLH